MQVRHRTAAHHEWMIALHFARHENDLRVRLPAEQRVAGGDAIKPRHHDVEHHDIWKVTRKLLDHRKATTGDRGTYLVTAFTDIFRDGFDQVPVVVSNEYTHGS